MSRILIVICCLLFVDSVGLAQKTKNAMTNADVVAMVEARLAESTIVLAIQQSETSFDTSTKSLIELKKQGVGQIVLEAMLQSKTTARTSPSVKNVETSDLSANRSESEIAAGMGLLDVVLIENEKRSLLKQIGAADLRGGYSILNPNIMPLSVGGGKPVYVFNGTAAERRITDSTPEFEITVPADFKAADYLVLVKFIAKSNRRVVELKTNGFGGSRSGFRQSAIVPVTLEQVRTLTISGALKFTIYRVKVVNPLPPGEYAFAPLGKFYDFGID